MVPIRLKGQTGSGTKLADSDNDRHQLYSQRSGSERFPGSREPIKTSLDDGAEPYRAHHREEIDVGQIDKNEIANPSGGEAAPGARVQRKQIKRERANQQKLRLEFHVTPLP